MWPNLRLLNDLKVLLSMLRNRECKDYVDSKWDVGILIIFHGFRDLKGLNRMLENTGVVLFLENLGRKKN